MKKQAYSRIEGDVLKKWAKGIAKAQKSVTLTLNPASVPGIASTLFWAYERGITITLKLLICRCREVDKKSIEMIRALDGIVIEGVQPDVFKGLVLLVDGKIYPPVIAVAPRRSSSLAHGDAGFWAGVLGGSF